MKAQLHNPARTAPLLLTRLDDLDAYPALLGSRGWSFLAVLAWLRRRHAALNQGRGRRARRKVYYGSRVDCWHVTSNKAPV